MAKGITGTGQGFDLPGRRLGGFSHQAPLSSLRQNVLAAAENRAGCGTPSPSGPKRIGGDRSIMSALSPIQAAAMTAEGRLHDVVWCGSKSSESEGPSERCEDCALPDDESTQSSPLGSIPSPETTDVSAMWQCSTCTLLNQPLAVACDACGIQKHGGHGVKSKIWSCKFCTLKNSIETERCLACGQWRYSYGQPVSTRGPNVGT